jgi:2-polyprenyl-6-methoxyphenol hydroxylase-like FAD-dependent oxidoreductase
MTGDEGRIMANPSAPQIVIAGAGPAGMVLAYQLVTNGVPVRVLEQHPDFEREFRGELLGPSILPALEQLGVLPLLASRGLAREGVARQMFVGSTRKVTLPGGTELGALVSQAGLLGLLHELCSRHPHYQLDFRTSAVGVVREGERVVALETRREGRDERVPGDVFVVCNGRNSKIRKAMGAELELSEKPDDTLWLRFDFSDAPEALPDSVEVHMFGKGIVVVFFATLGRPRLQIAYSAPGDVGALRKDLPALRERLLPALPEPLRGLVSAKLEQKEGQELESQVLRVAIDRLKVWHAPGLLFLGDAAHTMSPAGGQGLNLAIRDSIVAANHMIDAVRAGAPLDAEVFARIEAERRPEIEAAQAGQLRAHGMVRKPVFVQHLMFTMLGVVMRVKKFALPVPAAVEPRHAVRAMPA